MIALTLAAILFAQIPAPARQASGVISGEVRQEDGAPATGMPVSAFAAPEPNALSAGAGAILFRQAKSDSAGHYRLGELPEGRYYVMAGHITNPTYYPGVKSMAQARIVTVAPRGAVDAVNFQLAPAPGTRVRGQVSGMPINMPAGLIRVALTPASAGQLLEATVQSDGTFEFPKVLPGDYSLGIQMPSTPPAFALRVSLEDKDIHNLLIPLPPVLVGTVTVDDGSNLPVQAAAVAAGVQNPPALVEIAMRYTMGRGSVEANGNSFFILPAPVGEYRILATLLPFGYYVKSITYGNADALNTPIRVEAPPFPEIRITLTTQPPAGTQRGVKVTGRVVGQDGAPSSSGWVTIHVVAPDSPLGLAEARVGDAEIRKDGTFEALHVPPGTVTVRAMPDGQEWLLDVVDKDISGIQLPAMSAPGRGASLSNYAVGVRPQYRDFTRGPGVR